MLTGEQFAKQAIDGNYIGIPYSKLDCQGFVERVLSDCGIRKENGTVYDWRGSNSMYRNYQSWHGSIKDCEKIYGVLPIGCLVYTRKTDGGEKEKGYTDGLGNFVHVGIYLGEPHGVIHSTTGGVQWGKYPDKRWNYCSLLSMIDYGCKNSDNDIVTCIQNELDIVQNSLIRIEGLLKSL